MAKRTDGNQQEIMDALRDVGCLVWDTHILGRGAPDIIVLYQCRLKWLEVKVPGGILSPAEREFHDLWRIAAHGPVYVVYSVDDAFRAVGVEVT